MGAVIKLAMTVLILVFILAMIAIVVGGVCVCWGIILELMDDIQERENKYDDELS